MRVEELLDKKILVWGYGVEGKSIVDLLLKKNISNKILVATNEIIENDDSDKIDFILEKDILEFSKNINVLIKSPGVSTYREEIKKLKENGIFITSALNIMLAEANKHENLKIIGITGTKGKSTVSLITNHILNRLGYKSTILGNIGVPFLSVIDKFDYYNYLVLELSSYQVESLLYVLDYSIVLNLFPEHIHWHLNHDNYFRDKLLIIKYSKKSIVNGDDIIIKKYVENVHEYFNTDDGFHLNKNFIMDNDKKIFDINSIDNIRGEHIFRNICAILTFLKEENIDISIALNLLSDFKTAEHRLEIFYENKEKNTIFINDSISTIPESSIEALKTFGSGINELFLVLGGFDRQQDYGNLINFICKNKNIKKVFLLGQTGKKLKEFLVGIENEYFETLDELVKSIKMNDLDNKTVLLSPAAPSYDMFKNFEERGSKFKELMLVS